MSLQFRCPDKPYEVGPEFLGEIRPEEWLSQIKWDGWRCENYIDGPDKIRMLSSSGNDLGSTSASDRRRVIQQMKKSLSSLGVPDGSVLDSELIGPRGGHDWSLRIFDCLAWDGKWLMDVPYRTRWDLCLIVGARMPEDGNIHLCETIVGKAKQPNAFLEQFNSLKEDWIKTGRGLHFAEGIVVKRLSGTLTMSPRACSKSNHLYKIKYRDVRRGTDW